MSLEIKLACLGAYFEACLFLMLFVGNSIKMQHLACLGVLFLMHYRGFFDGSQGRLAQPKKTKTQQKINRKKGLHPWLWFVFCCGFCSFCVVCMEAPFTLKQLLGVSVSSKPVLSAKQGNKNKIISKKATAGPRPKGWFFSVFLVLFFCFC